jgi:hypothetical protein
MRAAAAAILSAIALASACQSGGPAAPAASGKSAALRNMEQVAIAAHRCWFASRDPAFRDYSFANELNSFSGRPRFLLVPKNDFGGRPLLVVEAQGAAGQVSAFGPLMDGEQGARVSGDIRRWSAGDNDCSASA